MILGAASEGVRGGTSSGEPSPVSHFAPVDGSDRLKVKRASFELFPPGRLMSNLDVGGGAGSSFLRTHSVPVSHDAGGSTFFSRTRSSASSFDGSCVFSDEDSATKAPVDIKPLLYHKAGSDPSARSMVHFQHLNRLNSSSTSSSVLPNINVAKEIALGHIQAGDSAPAMARRFASNRASRKKVEAKAGVMRLVASEGLGEGAAGGVLRFSMLDHQSAFGKKTKKKKHGDISLLMPMQVPPPIEKRMKSKLVHIFT